MDMQKVAKKVGSMAVMKAESLAARTAVQWDAAWDGSWAQHSRTFHSHNYEYPGSLHRSTFHQTYLIQHNLRPVRRLVPRAPNFCNCLAYSHHSRSNFLRRLDHSNPTICGESIFNEIVCC